MGPPHPRDPNLVEQGVAGLALARSVIHPTNPWPLKEANAYLLKFLTPVQHNRMS